MIFRGIRTVVTVLVLCAFSLTYIAIPAQAYTTNLSSQDFSKMYYFASKGDAQRLSMAISRGLNINATNINGDTGLCVAVRNQNITAYKTFRAVGANPRPECSWRIAHFDQFVISHQMTNGSYYAPKTAFPTARNGYRNVASTAAEKISTGSNAWYWIGGVALVGGGVALASGGGGGGGSSGGDSSGDDNNENICKTNPCAKGCYTNISDPEDDSTCTYRNSCGGCEVWTCPQETPKPTEDDKTYKCTAYYQCENGTRCKVWQEVDPFAKDATESTEDTVTNNESITKDGTNISGTWGGIYSAQKAVENKASITLTGDSNAVGIMSAASKNLNTARESEITTAGGDIDNTGDITIKADNSVGIFATTLGSLNESRDLAALGTISNNNDTAIDLTGNTVSGIELYGDGKVLNYGDITLTGNGYNVGIYYDNSNSISKTYTNNSNLRSTITNAGTIEITGGETPQENEAFVGIEAFGSEDNILAITNEGTITIEGNADLTGISAENGNITNNGNITLAFAGNTDDTFVDGISAIGNSSVTTKEGSSIEITAGDATVAGINAENSIEITNDGDISVTGAGEIYGIKAGDEAKISGAGDIILKGTNTSDTSQTMYGIYAGDNANITYTGNIKNESTGTNVTMTALQAGYKANISLGNSSGDESTINGDIILGNESSLTNTNSIITGNIKSGGSVHNLHKINGNINIDGELNNEGYIFVGGNEEDSSITAQRIKNLGNIGKNDGSFGSIIVTGTDASMEPYDAALYNVSGTIYGNITTENGSVVNDINGTIVGKIFSNNIKNNGTINGKITTETLNNDTAGATIESSELIARTINNSGIINIGAGTLAANKIGNYIDEENGTINVSAGMSFRPMSDGNGNGVKINLTNALKWENETEHNNLTTPIITILNPDEDDLNVSQNHDLTIAGITVASDDDDAATDSIIKLNASKTTLNLNEIDINTKFKDNSSIIDATGVAKDNNSIINVADGNFDATASGELSNIVGINAPNSTVKVAADSFNLTFVLPNKIDAEDHTFNGVGIVADELNYIKNTNTEFNVDTSNNPQEEGKYSIIGTFTGIKTNNITDVAGMDISITYGENGLNTKSATVTGIEFGENPDATTTIKSNITVKVKDSATERNTVYGIVANNSGSITLSENASIEVNAQINDIEYGAHLINTNFINKGTININNSNDSSYAVYMKSGNFENSGSIGNGGNALYQYGGSFLNSGEIKGNVTLENITPSTNNKTITGNVSIENKNEIADFVNGNGASLYGNLTLKNVNLINSGYISNTMLKVNSGTIQNQRIDDGDGEADYKDTIGQITFDTAELSSVTFINDGYIGSYYNGNGSLLRLDGSTFTNNGEINLNHGEGYSDQKDETENTIIGIEANGSELSLGGIILVGNITYDEQDNEIAPDEYESVYQYFSEDIVTGIKVSNDPNDSQVSGKITESGELNVYGKTAVGVLATRTGEYDNEGYFINNGTINVTTIYQGTAYGMKGFIEYPTDSGIVRLVNNGTINLKQEVNTMKVGIGTTAFYGYGMYGDGMDVSLYNLGTINIQGEGETTGSTGGYYCTTTNGASCSNVSPTATAQAFMLMRGARMYNTGTISQDSDMNFDEMGDGTGEVYFGKDAVFEAPSVSGTAIAMADHATGSNEDSYTTTGNFVADEVDVNVKSGTAMFMARPSGSGVSMQRIAFTDLLQDKELANYLESNYQSGNRVDLFDDLKQANDNNSLYDAAQKALGHEFFPLLAWQNQQRVRHFNRTMQDMVLDDDTLKSERTVAKFDSNYTEQDAANGLPGYEDKIYGVSGLFDKEVNKNYRFGVGIGLYNAYAEFDDDDTRRDAIVQAYQTNRFDYDNWGALVMPFAGYSRGEYKRYATNGKYEPHFNVWYLGLNNRAYLKQDLGNWRIEPTVELNLSSIYQDKVKEDNNIAVKGQNSLSVEAGAGAYAKRKYDLGENGALEIKGGAMYYRELNSKAYDDHSAQMYGMDGNYHISGYENDRNRAELSFKADYKIGKWSVYGEVSQSFADNDNTVYNAGIRLAF